MTSRIDDQKPPPEIVGLIPAAGRATRLAPLPFSKELVPIGFQTAADGADRKPKPVSQYLLDRMKLAGASKVFMIARQGKWDIADYYGDGSRLGLKMAYLHVGAPWGPPFTLTQATPFIGDADVVFGFPDILIDPPDSFSPLLERMHASSADVVLALFDCRADEPGDVVQVAADGRVTRIETKEERPQRPDHYRCWMFAVWNANFTRFLTAECERLARIAEVTVREHPAAKAPEWPVGALINAAIGAGLQVDSVHFDNGRFLDVGTPDGITAAARFPIVWNGIDTVPVAFWLIPAAADHQWLSERINTLAARHGGPVFEPHLTLHVGRVPAGPDLDARLEAALSACAAASAPLELVAGSTDQSDAFFKSLFISIDRDQRDAAELPTLQRRLVAALMAAAEGPAALAAYALHPHLSLGYGETPVALRTQLASEADVRGRTLRFDTIAAIRPAAGHDDLAQVDRWHVLGHRRLHGPAAAAHEHVAGKP